VEVDTRTDLTFQASLHTIKVKGPDDLGCAAQPKSNECIQDAKEAWKRLRLSSVKTWRDWMLMGKAFQHLRTEAMRAAHVNKPEGRRYNQEFSYLLKANDLDEVDKATRSRLFAILNNPEIESWLATLPTNKKLRLNHPDAIWRAYQNSLGKRPDGSKKPSQVEKLTEENARLKREVEHGSQFTRQDTAHDIAGVIFRTVLSPWKAREIARELDRLAARQTAEACA
jgi:hypothetical protein